MKVTRLFGEPSEHALDVLQRNFDIADVGPGESEASIQYTQERINAAHQAIKLIENPKERRAYDDWLAFFQGRIDEAKLIAPDSSPPFRPKSGY